MSRHDKLRAVAEFASLTPDECKRLSKALPEATADTMIENVIGTFEVPLGVATNFIVNGRDCLVPMATEEASVVAAASNAAKIARRYGGFTAKAQDAVMIGQIQILDVTDTACAIGEIKRREKELLDLVTEPQSSMVKAGGGPRGLEARELRTAAGTMLIVHLHVDVRDAMGANAVNTMCETLAPVVAEIAGGRPLLKILSNLADRRVAHARALFDKDELGGAKVVKDIVAAWAFADADPYRAATHNKGIMNGIDAVVMATGNDCRAVEAGAHAFAARTGRYRSLTLFRERPDGNLEGIIELPLALGTIGGATKVHPTAGVALRILGAKTASELASIVASVGLAQNLAALRALADEGIQEGHMRLHAKNIARMAGVPDAQVGPVVEKMISEGQVRMSRAKEIWDELQKDGK